MAVSFEVEVDLSFELERPGLAPVRGHVGSRGRELVLEVSDPGAFAGTGDAPSVQRIAETLAARGLVVRVEHDGQPVVAFGAVRAPWWQRRITGSRCIRVTGLRGAWASARARASGTPSVLPQADLLPPLTLFPFAPTLGYRRRNDVTTTHDPGHGGNPRLVLVDETSTGRSPVHWLHGDVTIGSDPACDVVLPGLEPVHARVRHDEDDEWMVDAASGVTRVHGGPVVSQRLRTGSMLQVGTHRLVFVRDEYADHGRPYGGRIGGELGQNTAQPPRA